MTSIYFINGKDLVSTWVFLTPVHFRAFAVVGADVSVGTTQK